MTAYRKIIDFRCKFISEFYLSDFKNWTRFEPKNFNIIFPMFMSIMVNWCLICLTKLQTRRIFSHVFKNKFFVFYLNVCFLPFPPPILRRTAYEMAYELTFFLAFFFWIVKAVKSQENLRYFGRNEPLLKKNWQTAEDRSL